MMVPYLADAVLLGGHIEAAGATSSALSGFLGAHASSGAGQLLHELLQMGLQCLAMPGNASKMGVGGSERPILPGGSAALPLPGALWHLPR